MNHARIVARAKKLGIKPSAFVRDAVIASLDARHAVPKAAHLAAVAAATASAKPSADAQVLATQIRPLGRNLWDLRRRRMGGEPVSVDNTLLNELITLTECRRILGDRVAGSDQSAP